MRITKVEITNVKSFYNTELYTLDAGLNIVVGPNAGGKSNLLEILQGMFNSVVFRPVSITKAQVPGVAYSVQVGGQYIQSNDTLVNELFDHSLGCESQNQKIAVECLIEQVDIENLRTMFARIDELAEFEKAQTGSMALMDQVRHALSIIGTPDNLLNAKFEICLNDHQTITPGNQELIRVDGFYEFLTLTPGLSIFINNLFNYEVDNPIDFRSSFTFMSASRVPINLGSMNTDIALTNVNDLGQASYTQGGLTTESMPSHFDALRHRLAINVHMDCENKNEALVELLKDINITVSISKIRRLDSTYKIEFKRLDGSSAKLSAGEKEFLNILSLFFVQDLKGGTVLIDEPEMHLHPRWQKKFLKLIQKLITQSNTQFILVTHSAHLIEPSTLSSLARVYKNTDAHSKIVKPTNAQLSSQPEKDVFQIVNILNSEKIYFADMVVLVEGVEDRIIYEKAVQILQPESNARTIEVVEVGGKKQFDKFQKHLDIFDIPHATIADLDYVSDIGTNEVKTAFKESSQKVVKRLKANDSLDSAAFGAELENLFSNKKEPYTDDDLKALRELWDYLLSKAASLIDELDDAQKKSLNEFLKNMEKQYIFLLPCGDLESLFGKSAHFNTETALAIAQSMKTDKDIPADLKRIVQVIIK